MGTNIVSKTHSRVFTHPKRAEQNAEAYAERMQAKGYEVHVRAWDSVYPPCYSVDVMRKK